MKKHHSRAVLPPLLHSNPDIKEAILTHCNDNLSTLSVESLHEYITTKCLPTLLETRRVETKNNSMTMEDLLRENRLRTVHPKTVNNWLRQLGYKYCPRKKNYYNDKHESEENVTYRYKFIQRYFEYEIMCHRWIQLPISKYEKMCEDGEVFGGQGYRYTNDKNKTYIEFHVDDNETLTAIGNTMPFGGNLSVRKPLHKKPLIIFGQDECIFKQYIFRNKCWNGPNGEVPLMPKDEGQGLMISAFVSREYGFSWDLTQSQLQLVNQYRQDKQYIDEVSGWPDRADKFLNYKFRNLILLSVQVIK